MESVTTTDVWNLKASPQKVRELADDYKTLGGAATNGHDKVRGAKRDVWNDEAWTGRTATSYGTHADHLVTALSGAGTHIASMRSALEDAADVLAYNQQLLNSQFAAVSGISHTRSGDTITFYPLGDDEQTTLTGALNAAYDIRQRVDEKLAAVGRTLSRTQAELQKIANQWQPKHLRMLNLNIGQGADNVPILAGGTDKNDIPALADLIINNNVDVATFQEVFATDARYLENELRRKTGENWKVHFGAASDKYYAGDGLVPEAVNHPLGNAVVVREGAGITSQHTDTIKLDPPGSEVQVRGPNGPVVTDGEGRSATRVRLTYGQ